MTFLKRLFLGLIFSVVPMTLYASNNSKGQTDQDAKPLMTIGVLGDSLSAAYGIKTEQGWVTLLTQRLKQEGINAKVVNGSVSGATTDAGLHMQAGLLANSPDILILELGANDGLQGKPLALIEQNLSLLITRSQNAGAKVLILGVQLPPNLGQRYTQPFFMQYQTLAQRHNATLVPFFLEGIAGNPALMQGDGLHPNTKAQPIILNNIWPALDSLITRLSAPSTETPQKASQNNSPDIKPSH